jgi:DNA-binding transcriptional MerR regulator
VSSAASRRETAPHAANLSIGEVLGQLREDFPDISISKIRYLEAEGLVEPARTPSGYRKFSQDDVERLRYILTLQRDHFWPLRVIREALDAYDRGFEPPAVGNGGPAGPGTPRVVGTGALADGGGVDPAAFVRRGQGLRMTRAELATAAGLDERDVTQLETFGLLTPGAAGHFDETALAIAHAAAELAGYGIEPRHLRPFRTAADREVGLVEQVVTPLARGRGDDAQARASEAAREISALCVQLHAALVKAGLGPRLG